MSTKIEWTDATWNPMVGCSRASPGCDHCYAEGQVHRFGARYDRPTTIKLGLTGRGGGLTFLPKDGDGKPLGKGAKWTGAVWLLPDVLGVPLRRRKPTRYFVNSLSDVFHPSVVGCEEGRRFIAAMFGVMAATPQHTYQILTKRPDQAREWFAWAQSLCDVLPIGDEIMRIARQLVPGRADDIVLATMRARNPWPLPNVWIGASVEDQLSADGRIPALLEVPAAVRFLSAEPMLGPVHILDHDRVAGVSTRGASGIDWVICGGESGAKARPMHPDWARSLRDQCVEAGAGFFFKQWGEWTADHSAAGMLISAGGPLPEHFAEGAKDGILWTTVIESTNRKRVGERVPYILVDGQAHRLFKVGKAKAGRELDGRTWDEMPE
jgi:protein gp37